MDATRVYRKKISVKTVSGDPLVIYMDLFQLPPPFDSSFPEGYKFSWTAFNPLDRDNRVLFDCHIPKGAHYHVDDDSEGKSFEWKSLKEAEELFVKTVQEKFGEVPGLKEILL